MIDSVTFIRQEIAKRQNEIKGLQLALDVLSDEGGAPKPKQQTEPKEPKEPRGNDTVLVVNGIDVKLSPREFQIVSAIADVEDCLPRERLIEVFGISNDNLKVYISVANKKLQAAGARVVYFKGEGYRLQNIEEAA